MFHPVPASPPDLGVRRSRAITVGLDGSRESLASVAWAADEARRRGLALRLLHVWGLEPDVHSPLIGSRTRQGPRDADPRSTAERIRRTHPGLDVVAQELCGEPATVLCGAAEESELLVLGSRGLSGVAGFVTGSVALSVVARTRHPVVLVPGRAPIPNGGIVLGLDLSPLRVIHGWSMPPAFAFDPALLPPEVRDGMATSTATALGDELRPWRDKYPEIRVEVDCSVGRPANQLVEASADASLVVVGRRIRRSAIGTHLGPVVHAVLHHATAPVAVVPHA